MKKHNHRVHGENIIYLLSVLCGFIQHYEEFLLE
jgi:hypothetical protein